VQKPIAAGDFNGFCSCSSDMSELQHAEMNMIEKMQQKLGKKQGLSDELFSG